MSVAIRPRALGLYVFTLILLWLAGRYAARPFLVLFLFLVLILLLSLAWLAAAFMLLRYHQEFSTEHPVKGETVLHRIVLANECLLPVHFVRVRFKTVFPGIEQPQPDFSAYLPARGRLEREYRIHCPYRGIYTVGLESLELEDPLHLAVLRRRVWYRTFYVYPRVLALRSFSAGPERGERLLQGVSAGGEPDFTLYSRLRGYRQGDPLRHVAWKKFASTGSLYLKEYDSSAEPGVSVYFDLRLSEWPGGDGGPPGATDSARMAALEREDVSVEILVALVKYFLDRGVPVTVRAPGRSLYSFKGGSSAEFRGFYESTARLLFQKTLSPVALYRYDREGGLEGSSAVVVSHRFDPEILTLVEASLCGEDPVALVLNRCSQPESERRRALPWLRSLSERGAVIRLVDGPETIRRDLEGQPQW